MPAATPLEAYGPAVLEPDDPVSATGGDIRTREKLETAYVEAYDTVRTRSVSRFDADEDTTEETTP